MTATGPYQAMLAATLLAEHRRIIHVIIMLSERIFGDIWRSFGFF